jgi:diguanylate cyclase (GGDEF)-like protein
MQGLSIRKLAIQIDKWLASRSKAAIILLCLGLVGLLGVIDFATGHELTIYFMYLLPILIITWYAGLLWGMAFTILSALVWTGANNLAGHMVHGTTIHYWNTGIRLLMFFILVYLLSSLKASLQHEKELSRTDYLTGVLNVREFMRLANLEIQRSRRYHHPLTLAYIDLNNFKQVNDTYGHKMGDEALRALARAMVANLRSSDLLGRMGGDEFAILFTHSDERMAAQALDKIRNVLLRGVTQHQLVITISVGVTTLQPSVQNIDEMLVLADELMYKAKANGKDAYRSR